MISKYATNTYEITDSYKKIQLLAKNAKVKIEPSDEKKWFHLLRVGVDHSEMKL